MVKVINPYAVILNRTHGTKSYNPIEEVTGRPVYRRGDYTIWKQEKRYYNTCWKNIIISQTTGAPVRLVDVMCGDGDPEPNDRYRLERNKEAVQEGMAYAKENGIEIVNI